jgi:hypothetical protein
LGRIRKRYRWPHRFCYSDVELTACRCRLVESVNLSLLENATPDIPGRDVEFVGRLTYTQIIAALDAAGCLWQLAPHEPSGQVALYTEPSVDIRAGFNFITTDDGGGPATDEHFLAKAGAWTMAAHDCPLISVDTVDDGLGSR